MNIALLQQHLSQHLQQLVRERDPFLGQAGHYFVREYIRQELANFGEVETHSSKWQGKTYENLILNIGRRAGGKKAAPILIGAHYDTVPGSPGADDNATGIAVLLELARYFSQTAAKYPIRLVAFDLEEYGWGGSLPYATLLRERGEKLRLMLSLESLGYCSDTPGSQTYPAKFLEFIYPSQGNFIALIGNLEAAGDMLSISRKMKEKVPCQWLPVPLKGKILPDMRRSDHAPFWDLGYRAMMVTDTADARNPNYHTAKDTIKTLDLDFLANVYQGLVRVIETLS
ncbi:M28 family peptidase [Acaryochloris thomasi]|uniref:M28 family peptidase n=1 Tax=Acaryochloris thomasi TaxID=2929456 RepID=UPI0018F108A9